MSHEISERVNFLEILVVRLEDRGQNWVARLMHGIETILTSIYIWDLPHNFSSYYSLNKPVHFAPQKEVPFLSVCGGVDFWGNLNL